MTYIYLVGAILYAVLILAVIVMFKLLKKKNKNIKELESENQRLADTIECLYKYSEEISKIRKDKEDALQEITQAESTEDILNIIAGLVSNNNDRLRNNQKKTGNATTDATKG